MPWIFKKHRASIVPASSENDISQGLSIESNASAPLSRFSEINWARFQILPVPERAISFLSPQTWRRTHSCQHRCSPSPLSVCENQAYETPHHHYKIYIGDHMTRSWTRDGRPTSVSPAKPGNLQPQENDKKAATRSCQKTPIGSAPTRTQSMRNKVKRKPQSAKDILGHCTITEDDLTLWQTSFDDLLKNPAGRYVFRSFLESEIADENLKFWLACEDLKTTTKQKRAEKMAQTIYDTYINVYSPHEVNIDYKMREDIVDQLKYRMDATVFTQAQHQIYTLMHRDSYPRFLSSPILAELTEEIMGRSPKLENKSKSETSLRRSTFICCCRRQGSFREPTETPASVRSATSPRTPADSQPQMEMSRVPKSDRQSISSDSADDSSIDDQKPESSDSKRSIKKQSSSTGGAPEQETT
uniref:Regulator of G-protein signaling rgs-7 n=1 Tax=Phallusia mammillata TaxID=59560 RepID=A0A6F9DQ39_9ASCI|nr:regulator of G-protein signaling rgs-7 [Phallusia mammillata]